MKRVFPLHPLLVAVLPTLVLFSGNLGEVSVSEVVLPLVLSGGLAALLLGLAGWIPGGRDRGAILASIALVLLFSHAEIRRALGGWELSGVPVASDRHLLIVELALIFGAFLVLRRTRPVLRTLTLILNVGLAGVVLFQVGTIGVYKIRAALSYRGLPPAAGVAEVLPPATAGARPDIYYIILDRYPSERCLKEFYDYDNRPFLDHLEQLGFYVAAESRSNYPMTMHSLASSLSMDYLGDLSAPAPLLSDDWMPLAHRLQDYRLWRRLRTLGYRYIHCGSGWQPTDRNRYADRNTSPNALPEFTSLLCQSTALNPLLHRLGLTDVDRVKRQRVLRQFRDLAAVVDDPAPTFVFAHFLVPHPPYVFDRDGKPLAPAVRARRSTPENMRQQLEFTNARVRGFVDTLLARSVTPPIVILQADEGPYPYARTASTFDFTRATDAELREKTSILNALYLPGVDPGVFYPTLSPVNTFRLIFDHYFGTRFGLLPDRSYAFPDRRHLYDFFDITDRVR
jgi:hypothetical protein